MTGPDLSWMIIINPKACGGRGLRHWPRFANLLNYYGVDFTCSFTERRYHAVEIAVAAIEKGYRNIAVFGGLGTFHEVVNGIFLQKKVNPESINAGFIPIMRLSGVNPLPRQYTERLRKIHPGFMTYDQAARAMCLAEESSGNRISTMKYPIVRVSYTETKVEHLTRLVLVGGIGFDAYANLLFNNLQDSGHGGKIRRLMYALASFILYRSVNVEVVSDGKEIYRGYMFSGRIETGITCTGENTVKLNLVKKFATGTRILHFKSIYSGRIYDRGYTVTAEGKKITIRHISEKDRERHAVCSDGETTGCYPVMLEYTGEQINLLTGRK